MAASSSSVIPTPPSSLIISRRRAPEGDALPSPQIQSAENPPCYWSVVPKPLECNKRTLTECREGCAYLFLCFPSPIHHMGEALRWHWGAKHVTSNRQSREQL
ncbi:hypothetical protein TNCV_1181601 [Trichonephila clavipes]|nr:hypothetical protein TNCV_1181601 [Trichonephila clavipes]